MDKLLIYSIYCYTFLLSKKNAIFSILILLASMSFCLLYGDGIIDSLNGQLLNNAVVVFKALGIIGVGFTCFVALLDQCVFFTLKQLLLKKADWQNEKKIIICYGIVCVSFISALLMNFFCFFFSDLSIGPPFFFLGIVVIAYTTTSVLLYLYMIINKLFLELFGFST